LNRLCSNLTKNNLSKTSNHLYIRADTTAHMGAGHIMRCIALAQAWSNRGGVVTFISHCKNKSILQRIQKEGFNHTFIEHPWPNPQDLAQTIKIVAPNDNNTFNNLHDDIVWFVIDGYHFTKEYHLAIQKNGCKLLLIDDYQHLNYYSADLILNQNIGANRYYYTGIDRKKQLLGPNYIMLRREFIEASYKKTITQPKATKILVTMGGSNTKNIIKMVLYAIAKINDENLNIKVIVGSDNKESNSLNKIIEHFPYHVTLIEKANMPSLMSWADMAVTAGGSTCWELCFTGVPFIVISIAENQETIALSLDNADIAVNLGSHLTIKADTITLSILALMKDPLKREKMQKAGRAIVDGKGTKRIIRQMIAGRISLRPAETEDAVLLWKWTNDPEVRSSSFKSDLIPWKDHLQWYRQKIISHNSWIFIAENQTGEPIGQIRFDRENNIIKISYSLSKKFRGIGLGELLLEKGITKMKTCIDFPTMIKADVKKNNKTSLNIFKKCGFSLSKQSAKSLNENYVVYQLFLQPSN
jgi:UDP-2,4-diacetamido-2,4,6-trideoxy-beta-L-altropyranose hydrolase